MKIEIEVSEENESTSSPWWMIIDPSQNFGTDENAIYLIASMVTGPFFSREAGEKELANRRYDYGKNAVVFCASGVHSSQYAEKVRY